jgi:hypothetical protein
MIIIQLQGGLVQDIFIKGKNLTDLRAIIVDEDVEGADPERITETRSADGGLLEACVHTEVIKQLPKNSDMDKIVKAYDKGGIN